MASGTFGLSDGRTADGGGMIRLWKVSYHRNQFSHSARGSLEPLVEVGPDVALILAQCCANLTLLVFGRPLHLPRFPEVDG